MKKNKHIKSIFLLLSALYLAGSFFIIEKLVFVVGSDENNEAKAELINKASLVRANIESAIFSEVYIANSLATVLTVDDELALSQFEPLAETLISKAKYIRNIGIATGYTITNVYPFKGNEKAKGFDFRTSPHQLKSVEKAKDAKSVILAGPLTLVQGGQAVIARYPIFEDYPENTKYWGGVSVVLNIEQLFDAAGLIELSQDYEVAIRGRDGKGEQGEVFFGSEKVFSEPDATLSVDVPNGSWLMAGKLRDAEVAITGQFGFMLRLIGYVATFALLISAMFLYRAYRLAIKASYSDVLTGLPNRRYAMELLLRLIEQSSNRPFSVITADLNNFKHINDTYGHDAGDYILKQVSDALVSNIRSSDYVFRLGGDEFLLVITSTDDVENLKLVVNKLKAAIKDGAYTYKGSELNVSLSAGFARYPDDSTDLDELLSISDAEMYEDKNGVKSRRG